mgnify:CR=1 FL=1
MLHFPHAKINLGLHVLRKREDGFHDIESVFYPVALRDSLEALPSNETKVILHQSDEEIPLQKNLVYKAWKLMHDKYNVPAQEFHLVKRIPSQAGLGGASSDAVSALKICKEVARLDISDMDMFALAAEIGSDCPFFLNSSAQIVTGRGDVTGDIDFSLAGLYIQIVKKKTLHDGSTGIPTPEAYAQIVPDENRPSVLQLISQPLGEWKNILHNDFQPYAAKKYPEIGEIIQKMYDSGAHYAAMTGSGSACFGLYIQKPENHFPGNEYFVYEGFIES